MEDADLRLDGNAAAGMFGEIFAMGGLNGFYIEVSKCESRGVVRAASRDPRAEPQIDHRYFSEARDLDRLVAAAQASFEVAKVLAESVKCDLLLPDAETARDEERLRLHFQDFHATDYHPSGTLRMGAENDELAVVDDHCRLRGIGNLYVADASVMPTLCCACSTPTGPKGSVPCPCGGCSQANNTAAASPPAARIAIAGGAGSSFLLSSARAPSRATRCVQEG